MNIFLSLYVALYRLTKGKVGGRMAGTRVLLLTTTGRKSGKTRTTPLGFFDWGGGYVIVASNSGGDKNPGWYYNLKNSPQATVQMFEREMPVTAQILSGEERAQVWQKVISISAQYAGYKKKTKRQIPLVLLRENG